MSKHRLSGCPSCAEPLEEGDRFCGVCGQPVPPSPQSGARPTLPITPPPPAPAPTVHGYGSAVGAAAAAPGWGSVSTAAPTLVEGPGGWADTPGGEDPYGEGAPQAVAPGHEPAYGSGPGGDGGTTGPQGPVPAGGAPHPAPATPPPPAPPAHGPAYGSGDDGAPARYDLPGGATTPATPPDAATGAEAAEDTGKTCVACRAGRVDTDGYCEHCGHAQPRERDHQEEELGSVAAVSDRGLRHHRNEDAFAVAATALPDGSAATVAIVCDGVSSASRPDEASAAAAGAANEALLDALPRGAHPQEAMHEAILAAAEAVNALAPEVPGAQNAPACTLVGAVVSGGLLTIGWVGDSRAYWVPDDRAALPRRLTEDDSWAAQMVAAGLMGEAEAYADVRAHAITGWLGADAYDLEPHTATFKPDHDGVVVVCTDGLWNYAESARDMAQVLPADAAVRPLHSAQVLVGHALDGGGHDNVTVAVVPFAARPEPAAGAHPETEAEPHPQV
ncbi:protein phosphatase 2C domain-containing protein [Streptomyces sp. NPDC048340]|uniref:protein phosphatase 2C domain-containing protein n=1 Tax=Streptomyces sp. NPDC048340 TaxID=3365537 RepID=UPI00371045BF